MINIQTSPASRWKGSLRKLVTTPYYLVLNMLRRLGTRSARNDFLSALVEKVDNGQVDKEEMTAHVSTLV